MKPTKFRPFQLVTFTIMAWLLTPSCDKHDNPIPNVKFSAIINLSLPDYNKNAFYIKTNYGRRVGVNGILVVRAATGEYHAFERYCPYDQSLECSVNFDDDYSTATCPCCKSQFLIAAPDGDVLQGPSPYPLKTYKTILSGQQLTIYN